MRKSDLDMARLVEHMNNPVSKSIPERLYISLLAAADCSAISREMKEECGMKHHISKSLLKFLPME